MTLCDKVQELLENTMDLAGKDINALNKIAQEKHNLDFEFLKTNHKLQVIGLLKKSK